MASGSSPTPFPDLNAVLRMLVEGMRETLGDNFFGAYLQGSFAVGDFDEHSDVDFVVVARQPPSPGEVERLQVMHERIYALASPWAQHLEGSYFPEALLRRPPSGERVWYLDHGARSLVESDHCNTLLVRCVLREFGIALHGPPPNTLIGPISLERLRAEMLGTITGWGREILADPDRYDNRFYQGFIVLSYCRMLHDLREGVPGSKRAGADWAKAHLDPSWRGLIDRAWSGRPDPARSVREGADAEDFAATLRFVQYVIDESLRSQTAR